MKTIILSLFSLLLISSALAQSADEKEVTANVEALRKAMIDADKAIMENLVANELSYGHSSGKMEAKSDFLEVILSGKNDYKTIDLSNQVITIVDNVALVRHTFVAEVLIEGVLGNPKIGVLQVWKKNKNKWQLLARQAFKL